MIFDHRGEPTTGIEIDAQGRVLLWHADEFGRLRSKHLFFVNVTRSTVEFRRPHATVTFGMLVEHDDKWHIRIDLPGWTPP